MGLFSSNEDKACEYYDKAEKCYNNKEYEKMIPLYEKAAALGHLQSMHCLGYSYRHGQGVAQNLKKAYEWYKMAADKGYLKSIYAAGYMLFYGEDIAQDIEKGLELIEFAAYKNYPLAIYKIGQLKYYGEGMEQDKTAGLSFLGKAAVLGSKPAIKLLSEIHNTSFVTIDGHVEDGLTNNYRKSFENYNNYEDGIALVKKYREYGLYLQATDIMNKIKEDAKEFITEAITAVLNYYKDVEDYISLLEFIYMIVYHLDPDDALTYTMDTLAKDEEVFMDTIDHFLDILKEGMADKYYDLHFKEGFCICCGKCSQYLDVVTTEDGLVTGIRTPASKENRLRFHLAQYDCMMNAISISDHK